MGSEQRKNPRMPSYAKAMLVDSQIPGYIRDLSRSGCQVAFMQTIPAAVGEIIAVRVIAEHDQTIPPFLIHLRIRWTKKDDPWSTLGGQIEPMNNEKEKAVFERLVTYYAGAQA
jgi:hypothetical protein